MANLILKTSKIKNSSREYRVAFIEQLQILTCQHVKNIFSQQYATSITHIENVKTGSGNRVSGGQVSDER